MSAPNAILNAVKEALEATGAFDEVWTGGLVDPRGRPSGELLGVGIEPGLVAAEQLWDAGPAGQPIVTVKAALRVVVRHVDPQIRDAEADRLTAVVRNALDGQSLAAANWPDFTRVGAWNWLPPSAEERQVLAAFETRFLEPAWASADAS